MGGLHRQAGSLRFAPLASLLNHAPSLSSGSVLTREQCYFTNPFMFFCRVLHRIVKERKAKSEKRKAKREAGVGQF